MTDIIARAKKLAENGHTPAPWFVGETPVTHRLAGGEVYEDGGDPVLVLGVPESEEDFWDRSVWIAPKNGEVAAFAPEAVVALAEEKYQYTAQVFMNQHWVFMWSPRTGNPVDGKWHPTRNLAEKFAEQWQLDYPIRLVRRRISPVEVVE